MSEISLLASAFRELTQK